MSDTEPSVSISEQAARWWVTLHGPGASLADRHAFGEWVRRSPERVEAYLKVARLEGVLRSGAVRWPHESAEELIRQARGTRPDVVPLVGQPPVKLATPSAGPRLWQSALAATLLLAVAAVVLWSQRPPEFRTAIGEQRSVVLSDGSLITLNTASRVRVDLGERRRVVRLLSGEALFRVARDPARPFEVIVDRSTIRAVGTQFNVARRGSSTTVTVVEGRVAVTAGGVRSESSEEQSSQILLDAAQRVVITESGAGKPQRLANLATATAWTQRRLVFEHRLLGDVAEEFNRYNQRSIRIEDENLRRQAVTGVFEANDPESFMQFLAQIPGVRIEERENGRIVTTGAASSPQ